MYWTLDIVFFYYYFYSASVCTSSAIAIVFIKGYLTWLDLDLFKHTVTPLERSDVQSVILIHFM